MFQVANQLQIEEGEHRGVSKSMGRQRALARCLPTLIALAAAVSSAGAHAADWFVRPNGGSYGTATGKSWTTAFNGFSGISWSSVACGDTIWVAGGTYTQDLLPAKKCSSSARLSIRRARRAMQPV